MTDILRIRLPFREQIDFFRGKLNLPTERWDDILKSAHDRAFIVAGAMSADLLDDLRQAVDGAISGGTTLDEFRKQFRDIVQKRGWHGWTGEGTQAGEAWRTRVIFNTNVATSYAAGRWQQLHDPDLLKVRPYWRYVHNDAVTFPRPLHKRWGDEGLTLRHDHDFWKTHFPPNGWGCRCRVKAVRGPREDDATEPPSGWDQRDDKKRLPGIDRGWDYAPGASVAPKLRDFVAEKVGKLPPTLGQALQENVNHLLAPVYSPQKTAKDAARWAMENNLADYADYGKIHVDAANEWNKSLFDHLAEFPELRGNQRFTGTAQAQNKRWYDLARKRMVDELIGKGVVPSTAERWADLRLKKPKISGNVWAHSWDQRDVSGVAINEKWGKDIIAFRASLDEGVRTGFHPPGCNTIKSIVDHELGHQLDSLLAISADAELKMIYNELISRNGVKDAVSTYATKNIKEFIAEAWAESCNNPQPRDAARSVAAIIRARYRSRFSA